MLIITFENIISIATLSFIIGIILTICLLLRGRFAENFKNLMKDNLEGSKLDRKYIILYALLLFPATIYILNNLKADLLIYFYFFVGFLILGVAGFILTKNIVVILSGLIYPFLYFNYWNIYTFNLIAILFVVSLILLMSNLISWNIVKLFFVLLLIMDIILVFITKEMVHFGNKIVSLQIPILISIPFGYGITIGLGDIFFIGLLCLQFTKEKGYPVDKSVEFAWMTTALFFVMLYLLAAYLPQQTYPATIFVALSFIGATVLFRPDVHSRS